LAASLFTVELDFDMMVAGFPDLTVGGFALVGLVDFELAGFGAGAPCLRFAPAFFAGSSRAALPLR
jgi:hypothetical protein